MLQLLIYAWVFPSKQKEGKGMIATVGIAMTREEFDRVMGAKPESEVVSWIGSPNEYSHLRYGVFCSAAQLAEIKDILGRLLHEIEDIGGDSYLVK